MPRTGVRRGGAACARLVLAGLIAWPANALAASFDAAVQTTPSAGLVALGPTAASTGSTESETQAEDGADLLFLGVTVNGRACDKPLRFLRRAGALYIRASDLKRLRIRPPPGAPMMQGGEAYTPLSAWPRMDVTLDPGRQIVQLSVPADLFEASSLTAAFPRTAVAGPSTAATAAYLNYDLTAQYSSSVRSLSAFVESGFSSRAGLIVNSALVADGSAMKQAVRLDSYYVYDDPLRLTRLVLGDDTTDGDDWFQSVRFGGVRYGTQFDLQPGLITFPTPVFAGRTLIPSNVELYVNNALRYQGDVMPGPFTLNQLPVITGAGQVAMVIRDALGVEHQVTSAYYVSSSLLRQGLSSFSMEAGAERIGYGLESFDYQYPFAAGAYRRGLTDWLTVEARGQAGQQVRGGGLGAAVAFSPIGEFGVALAGSQGEAGAGGLVRAYFSRISPRWTFSLSYLTATAGYTQIGVHGPADRIREQSQAFAGASVGHGSLSAGYTDLRRGDGTRTRIESVNYSVPLWRPAYLSLFLLRSDSFPGGLSTTIGAGLSIPIGRRGEVYAQADSQTRTASYQLTPPTDAGWGYRVALSRGQTDQSEADVTLRGRDGEVTAEAVEFGGQGAARLLATGGVIFADGGVYPSREVTGGFAVVDVPDAAGVRILEENRPVTRTGADGHAVITDLRPYEPNRISLDTDDLPLEASLDTDVLWITPRFHGGVDARFGVRHGRPGTVILRLPSGLPLEAGTAVSVDDGAEQVFAGYDGEVFVSAVHAGMIFRATRADGICDAVASVVPKDGILPTIGPLTCVPVGAGR